MKNLRKNVFKKLNPKYLVISSLVAAAASGVIVATTFALNGEATNAKAPVDLSINHEGKVLPYGINSLIQTQGVDQNPLQAEVEAESKRLNDLHLTISIASPLLTAGSKFITDLNAFDGTISNLNNDRFIYEVTPTGDATGRYFQLLLKVYAHDDQSIFSKQITIPAVIGNGATEGSLSNDLGVGGVVGIAFGGALAIGVPVGATLFAKHLLNGAKVSRSEASLEQVRRQAGKFAATENPEMTEIVEEGIAEYGYPQITSEKITRFSAKSSQEFKMVNENPEMTEIVEKGIAEYGYPQITRKKITFFSAKPSQEVKMVKFGRINSLGKIANQNLSTVFSQLSLEKTVSVQEQLGDVLGEWDHSLKSHFASEPGEVVEEKIASSTGQEALNLGRELGAVSTGVDEGVVGTTLTEQEQVLGDVVATLEHGESAPLNLEVGLRLPEVNPLAETGSALTELPANLEVASPAFSAQQLESASLVLREAPAVSSEQVGSAFERLVHSGTGAIASESEAAIAAEMSGMALAGTGEVAGSELAEVALLAREAATDFAFETAARIGLEEVSGDAVIALFEHLL